MYFFKKTRTHKTDEKQSYWGKAMVPSLLFLTGITAWALEMLVPRVFLLFYSLKSNNPIS